MATARRSVAATPAVAATLAVATQLVTIGVWAFAGVGCNGPEKADKAGPAPTSVPIRRLTNPEYLATVADLFPGYTMPQISFVPDPKVLGFTNLSSSQTGSLVHMEQYESAAFSISQLVAADPTTLTGCDASAQGESVCAGLYLADLGKRAYRRPLSDGEQANLMALLAKDTGAVDYPTRLALVIQAMLMSPKFLFRPEIGDQTRANAQGIPLTSWEVASRLSYFLTGSIPDAELAAAADADALQSPDVIVKQARRLLTSDRAQSQLVKFHMQWLGTDTISALAKDMNAYPDFNPLLAYYMGKETDLFLRKSLFEEGGTYAELLLADFTYANGPLAKFYGVAGPDETDTTTWQKVKLDPSKNVGLLTQGSLTATMAKQDRTDPIRRGKFVLNQILCRSVNPPPPEIVAMFQPLDLSKTARDQLTQHRTNEVCAQCHKVLDPLGLPFEHYDGMGRWRDDDRGMEIDASGQIDETTFDGVPQMAHVLADMPEARACYVTQWLRFSEGKLNGDGDAAYINWLMTQFTRNTRIVDLVAAIVGSDSFRYRAPPMP